MMSDRTNTFVDEFRSDLESEGASTNTIKAYTKDLAAFLDWAEARAPEGAGPEDVATLWLNEQRRTMGAATVNRRASSLRRWFEYRGTAPLSRYRCPPAPPGVAHPLPNLLDDVRAMLSATDDIELRKAVALMGYAGLRVSEARHLPWTAIKFGPKHEPELHVTGKGNKTRIVPMAPELLAVMAEHDPQDRGDPWIIHWSDRGLREAVTRLGEAALIDRPVASHDLRMTFGTVVWNATKDLRVVQELMGHSSSKTTERYTGVTEETKRMAVLAAMPDPEDGDGEAEEDL